MFKNSTYVITRALSSNHLEEFSFKCFHLLKRPKTKNLYCINNNPFDFGNWWEEKIADETKHINAIVLEKHITASKLSIRENCCTNNFHVLPRLQTRWQSKHLSSSSYPKINIFYVSFCRKIKTFIQNTNYKLIKWTHENFTLYLFPGNPFKIQGANTYTHRIFYY